MTRITKILTALAAGCALVAAPASAHVKTGSDFYFWGATYKEKQLRTEKDPLNLIFMGGANEYGSNKAHAGNVGLLLSDWDPKFQAPMIKPWDTPKLLGCQVSQWLRWRYMPGGETVREDFQRLATTPGCWRQYHIRGWEDGPHWRNVSSHGRRDQYVIAGIHHERRTKTLTHVPDRDWDAVRNQAVSALKTQCSYRRWAFYPGKNRPFQNKDNDGWIARISLHRVRDGGCAGQ